MTAQWIGDTNSGGLRLMVKGRNVGQVQVVKRRFKGHDFHSWANGMALGIYLTEPEAKRSVINRLVDDGHLDRKTGNALLAASPDVIVDTDPTPVNLAASEFKPLSQRLKEKEEADAAAKAAAAQEHVAGLGKASLEQLKGIMAKMPPVEPILTNAERQTEQNDVISAALEHKSVATTQDFYGKSVMSTIAELKQANAEAERVLTEQDIANAADKARPRKIQVLGTAQVKTESDAPQPGLTMEERVYTRRLLDCVIDQKEFSEATFGPGQRLQGVLKHIRKELKEIELTNGLDLMEWIDVAFLALDGAWRAGFTPEEVVTAWLQKFDINVGRKWPDWRTMPKDVPIEHDRSGEVATPKGGLHAYEAVQAGKQAADQAIGQMIGDPNAIPVDYVVAIDPASPHGDYVSVIMGKRTRAGIEITGSRQWPSGYQIHQEPSGIYLLNNENEVVEVIPADQVVELTA
jgi:hypothetical protein